MARVKLLQTREDVAPEHHALFDELAALRGRVSGPSTVVLYSPGLSRPWNEISEFLHRDSIVEAPDAELAVCATAREYDCGYIWAAHVPNALKAGIDEATIAAVRNRGSLDALSGREAAIVRYVQQFIRTNRVEPGLFDGLLQAHDARWLVELTAWIGRYSALACILNAFEVAPAPEAAQLPVSLNSPPSPATARPLGAEPRIAQIISKGQLREEDQRVFDTIAEGRGNVRGPWSLLLYSPDLARRVFDVSNYLRFASLTTPRLRELATIATAREKDCPYVWAAHAPAARKEGIPAAVVDAIRDRAPLDALPRPTGTWSITRDCSCAPIACHSRCSTGSRPSTVRRDSWS